MAHAAMLAPEVRKDTSRDKVLELETVFEAPIEVVFRAFTDPKELAKWWGPKGCTGEVHEMDLRPGGAWRTSMHHADGTESRVGGLYEAIEPPHRLVFTWAWERDGARGHETRVTIELAPFGAATHLKLHQALFQENDARDKHGMGWTSSFGKLAESLA